MHACNKTVGARRRQRYGNSAAQVPRKRAALAPRAVGATRQHRALRAHVPISLLHRTAAHAAHA
jgi:hypothetical protein